MLPSGGSESKAPQAYNEWGQLGKVTVHMPCRFRFTLRQRDERFLVAAA